MPGKWALFSCRIRGKRSLTLCLTLTETVSGTVYSSVGNSACFPAPGPSGTSASRKVLASSIWVRSSGSVLSRGWKSRFGNTNTFPSKSHIEATVVPAWLARNRPEIR